MRIDWRTPTSDWDVKVFRDVDANGNVDPGDNEIGSSAQGTTTYEEATLAKPNLVPGGSYIVRVTNFAAVEPYEGTITFGGPPQFEPARTESWTLTCERPDGEVFSTQQIRIARGQRQAPDLSACAARLGATPTSKPTTACASAAILRWVKATAAGHGVRFAFSKRVAQKVEVDVFQVTVGRHVIGSGSPRASAGSRRSPGTAARSGSG